MHEWRYYASDDGAAVDAGGAKTPTLVILER